MPETEKTVTRALATLGFEVKRHAGDLGTQRSYSGRRHFEVQLQSSRCCGQD